MNEIDRARDALNNINAECSRENWIRAGMAGKSAGLSFDDFLNWSEKGGNFADEKDCLTVWKSFDKSGGVTPATLYGMAFAQGWTDPIKSSSKANSGSRSSTSISKPKQSQPKPAKQAASGNAETVWDRCIQATYAEAYIHRKQGKPDGLRIYPASAEPLIIHGQNVAGYLAVPCWDRDKLQTIQFIPSDGGDKLNLPGASFNDGFFTVGDIASAKVFYAVEGIGHWFYACVPACRLRFHRAVLQELGYPQIRGA